MTGRRGHCPTFPWMGDQDTLFKHLFLFLSFFFLKNNFIRLYKKHSRNSGQAVILTAVHKTGFDPLFMASSRNGPECPIKVS